LTVWAPGDDQSGGEYSNPGLVGDFPPTYTDVKAGISVGKQALLYSYTLGVQRSWESFNSERIDRRFGSLLAWAGPEPPRGQGEAAGASIQVKRQWSTNDLERPILMRAASRLPWESWRLI